MNDQIELELNTDQFDKLHKAFNARGKSISVNKEDLKKLLLDHGKLINKLESFGVRVVDAGQI